MTALYLDSREPDWIKKLTFGGLPTAVMMLDYGDIWVATDDGCLLLIERKTPDDFLNSLKNDRLFGQLEPLANKRYDEQLAGKPVKTYPYLLITGVFGIGANGLTVTDRQTGWSYAAVMSAILSIQEMGVFVLFCAGDTDVEAAILRLAAHKRGGELPILPARPAQMLGPKEALLSCLPHIGIERSQEILQWAGWNLAHALIGISDPEITAPVGKKVREDIRRFLGLQNAQTMELVLNESNQEILVIYEEKEKA
jgi:hypothetical protein